jgi:hypothetical protein
LGELFNDRRDPIQIERPDGSHYAGARIGYIIILNHFSKAFLEHNHGTGRKEFAFEVTIGGGLAKKSRPNLQKIV